MGVSEWEGATHNVSDLPKYAEHDKSEKPWHSRGRTNAEESN